MSKRVAGSTHHFLSIILLIALLAGALVASAQEGGPEQGAAPGAITNGTIYVDWEAGGANDGSSWDDAFTDLQGGLAAAQEGEGDEIWVAAGTYYPSVEVGGSGDRYKTFQMKNGVGIYGGFDPTAGDLAWEDRDWAANETILSGDVGTPGDDSDNCYHVFYHPSGTDLDNTAILDGFTVTGGNADGDWPGCYGGGMSNYSSSPTLTNCTFVGNSALDGAGMHNYWDPSPTLTNCTFVGNSASNAGGGMGNIGSSPVLTNCTFKGNSADEYTGGGMMNNYFSSPVLTNCTFEGNSAVRGGGVDNSDDSSPVLTNCILWADTPDEIYDESGSADVTYSDIQGGYTGEGNIDEDPLFVDAAAGDYHLGLNSPCIDVGDNDAPELPDFDFEGDARVLDGDGNVTCIVDMGVDEVAVDWPYFHVYLPVVLSSAP